MVMRINNDLARINNLLLPRGKPSISDGNVMLHLMLGHGVLLKAWLRGGMEWGFAPSVKLPAHLGEPGGLFYAQPDQLRTSPCLPEMPRVFLSLRQPPSCLMARWTLPALTA
jgi:hypothetical protein